MFCASQSFEVERFGFDDWVSFSVGDTGMNRINCYSFYALGKLVGRLMSLKPESQHIEIYMIAMRADAALRRLSNSDLPLPATEEAAKGFLQGLGVLNSLFEKEENENVSVLPSQLEMVFLGISKSLEALENVMSVELVRAPIYSVPLRGVFNTESLLDSADDVFGDIKDKVPEDAKADTRQAGRSLAFDLSTAAGFHIARALETVLVITMNAFGCSTPKESQRNWGFYIRELDAHGLKKEAIHHLTQLKDLHRNPLIHPEITLTPTEAQQLWALCTTLIMVLIEEIETHRPVTVQ